MLHLVTNKREVLVPNSVSLLSFDIEIYSGRLQFPVLQV